MIYVTGDNHQWTTFNHIERFAEGEGAHLTKDDYLIICGDFGMLWNYEHTGEYMPACHKDDCWVHDEAELYDWFNAAPWTTLWVDGNHENFSRLALYPVSEWHGGRVQKISDSIIHLMRGEVFEIDGKTIFTFGGAQSTDRGAIKGEEAAKLAQGKWWWSQEIPTTEEFNHGMVNLAKYNDKVDYVITHDCPLDTKNLLYLGMHDAYGNVYANEVSKMLQGIANIIDYKRWFCGHLHTDKIIDKVVITYKEVWPIDMNFEESWNEFEKRVKWKGGDRNAY